MCNSIKAQAEGSQTQGAGSHSLLESLEPEAGYPQLPVSPHRGHCPQVGKGLRTGEELEKDGRQGLLCPPL